MPKNIRLSTLPLALTLLAACTAGGGSSPAASEAASGAAGADCTADSLETIADGRLTIGTSNPAYPPYFEIPDEAAGEVPTEPWALGDPTNGRGFESAVAYAIAEELGYSREDVDWIEIPFDLSYAPGEKDFDLTLQQISYTPERAEVVDMSEGYFFVNQALVAKSGSDIAGATTVEELKPFALGVASGTTSLSYVSEVIQPDEEASVYNDNDAAIAALDAEQIDGIVVDVPTAFFITGSEQVENGVIVGQFPPADDEQERFSVVLEKDNALTECVNQAIATLTESGDLDAITQEWMSENAGAPEITP